jgi:hypothetical protein
MSLTTEERAEINRENASHSTGPVTDDGRAKSRQNALKHGLRAEVVPLPHEDPETVRIRTRLWNDHYLPKSPAAQHLLNECVQATLLADRVHKYHAAALSEQVNNALTDWEKNREETLEYFLGRLPQDPQNACLGLLASSLGCRWVIAQWERLQAILDTTGYWSEDERDEVVRLLGSRSEARYLKDSEHAWTIHLYHIICQPVLSQPALDELCSPQRVPGTLRGAYHADDLPHRDDCLAALRVMIAHEIDEARERECSLKATDEARMREWAGDRVSILQDAPTARLFLRYHSEARTTFHRALSALMKALALDAEAAASADNPPADLVAASSPNEANLKGKPPKYRPRRPGDAKRTLPGAGKANKAAVTPSRALSSDAVSTTIGVTSEPESAAVVHPIATG